MLSYLKNAITSFIFEEKYEENNVGHFKTFTLENSCSSDNLLESQGKVSYISMDFGMIDSKYSFSTSIAEKVDVGDFLWYQYWPHPTGEDSRRIVKIKLINDDIDNIEEEFLNENQVVVNIIKREGRLIYFSNDMNCNLDEVHVENSYIPELGDVVKIDLLNDRDTLLVHKIKPNSVNSDIGVLVELKGSIGFINNCSIWFTREVLQSGYEPIVGDNVKFAALTNIKYDASTWRAYNITFHSMEDDKTNYYSDFEIGKNSKNAISIIGASDFGEVTLDSSKSLILKIKNDSNEACTLKKIIFRREQMQIRIENISLPCVIESYSLISVKFTCYPAYVGFNSEVVDFCFDHFEVSRRFEMIVSCPLEYEYNSAQNLSKKRNIVKPFDDGPEQNRTYGQRLFKKKMFRRSGNYAIPPNISRIFSSNYESQKDENLALLEACPVLKKELVFSNYAEKFHTLLFLEKMAVQKALLQLSKSHVFFRKSGEYLVLDMPGVAEQRPSIIVGDKVLVTQPWSESDKTTHVGIIHILGRDTISVMFHDSFYNSYNQTDCNVQFENASNYGFLHEAIKQGYLKLKEPILFPTALSPKPPKFHIKGEDLNLYNKTLNIGQRTAIANILSAECRPLPYIVFGPPGTGKTVTIVESVLQITRCFASSRVLVCAPSNSAADLLASRIIQGGNLLPGQLIRIYAYSRQQESIPEELLPFATSYHDDDDDKNEGDGNQDLKLGWHRITVGTCTSIASLHLQSLPQGHFSHIVLDEAGYATEPQLFVPLTLLDPLTGVAVLAGDPKQLGPVVTSNVAKEMGLAESYLTRIIERFPYIRDKKSFPNSFGYDPRVLTKLTLNYRSVPDILTLPNKLFYNSELEATVSPKVGREYEIIKAFYDETSIREIPVSILFHGIRGQSLQEDDSPSWFNPQELFHVVQYIRICYKIGIDPSEVGVITPYRKQVVEIRKLLTAFELEVPKIGSVEEFQGQERQVMIMSCVRSQYQFVNDDKKFGLGFVSNPRRINVALTRARSLLLILGNPHLLSCDPYWRSVITYCLKLDAYIGCDIPNNFEKIMLDRDRLEDEIQPEVLNNETREKRKCYPTKRQPYNPKKVEIKNEQIENTNDEFINLFPVVSESHINENGDFNAEW